MDIYDVSGSQTYCMQHCEHLGSRAPSFIDINEWNAFKKLLERKSYRTNFYAMPFWAAIDDKETEGEWRDHYTHTALNHTKVWAWEPDRGRDDNCAMWYSPGQGLNDVACDAGGYKCICKRRPRHFLKLRGLCNDSAIDTFYQPMNNLTDVKRLNFYGLRTNIEYDRTRELWKLMVTDEQNVTALSKASLKSYALGRHNWTIRGDRNCNERIDVDTYTTELKLSGCNDTEFTCNNGQCVSMEHRCDQLPHCRDSSDEMGCDIFLLKDGYNLNIPPIISNQGKKIPVEVNVSIDILRLVDINEEDYSIEIQFEITLEWKENRATYLNLKANNSLNALNQKDIEKLWLPEVVYENTDQKESTRLGFIMEWKTEVEVRREGSHRKSGLDTVDEAYIYEGNENTLIMTQAYTHSFQCQYDFQCYPFDTQVGCIYVVIASYLCIL